jgi:hypothetical protein
LRSTLITAKAILSRLSPAAQDFICLCMQQRFTDKEMNVLANKGTNNFVGEKTAHELLNHPWISNTVN